MRFISCTAVTALLALGHSSLAIAAPGLDLASSTLVAGGPSAQSCQVSQDRRTDCGYLGVNKDECERSGCCWDPVSNGDNNVPWCFHRSSG